MKTIGNKRYKSRVYPRAAPDGLRGDGARREVRVEIDKSIDNFKRREKIMANETRRRRSKVPTSVLGKILKHARNPENIQAYLNDMTLADGAKMVQELGSLLTRNEIGLTGLSILKKVSPGTQVENTTAIGSMSNSTVMHLCSKHTPRRSSPNVVSQDQYCTKKGIITSAIDQQTPATLDMLSCVPPTSEPSNTAADSWTRLYCERAWERHLDSTMFTPNTGATDKKMPNQQISLHYRTLTSELTLSNMSTTNCVVTIYDLVSKFQTGNATWQDQYLSRGYMDPNWAWRTGIDGNGIISLGASATVNTVNTKPNLSTTFNRTFKIVGETKVNMTGASTHIHRSIYGLNKTQSYQEYDANTSFLGADPTTGTVKPWKEAHWQPTRLIVVRGVPESGNIACAANISWSELTRMTYDVRTGTGRSIDFIG